MVSKSGLVFLPFYENQWLLDLYSPLLELKLNELIKLLKPSSIHPNKRSFEPTIIGNQL
jgi:hypothetical protein